MVEFKTGEFLVESPIGGIVKNQEGKPIILIKTDHKFTHDHIRPRTPSQEAQRIITKFNNERINCVVVAGSMNSGKSEVQSGVALQYLTNGKKVDYIRPANARNLSDEPSLSEIDNIVIEPNSTPKMLDAFAGSSADLIVVDEVNIAAFLNSHGEQFFPGLISIAQHKMELGKKVLLGMLDRKFNGEPFESIGQVREWALSRRDVMESHMQASCICGKGGQISNRVVNLGCENGFKGYIPVSLNSPVEGINNEYIVLCLNCFSVANGLDKDLVRETIGASVIPVGNGFIEKNIRL